jgi:hypothetical protein
MGNDYRHQFVNVIDSFALWSASRNGFDMKTVPEAVGTKAKFERTALRLPRRSLLVMASGALLALGCATVDASQPAFRMPPTHPENSCGLIVYRMKALLGGASSWPTSIQQFDRDKQEWLPEQAVTSLAQLGYTSFALRPMTLYQIKVGTAHGFRFIGYPGSQTIVRYEGASVRTACVKGQALFGGGVRVIRQPGTDGDGFARAHTAADIATLEMSGRAGIHQATRWCDQPFIPCQPLLEQPLSPAMLDELGGTRLSPPTM